MSRLLLIVGFVIIVVWVIACITAATRIVGITTAATATATTASICRIKAIFYLLFCRRTTCREHRIDTSGTYHNHSDEPLLLLLLLLLPLLLLLLSFFANTGLASAIDDAKSVAAIVIATIDIIFDLFFVFLVTFFI